MRRVLIFLVCVLGVASPVSATVYNDAVGEAWENHAHLDIVSVEVTNDATNLMFTINLTGDPITDNWGKYLVAIDSVAAGDTASNGWGRPISMPSGMDYWIGSWVDSGGGAETYSWNGAVWNMDNATYNPPSDIGVPAVTTDSVTLTTSLASLGLSGGGTFVFDVFTTAGGGTDSATDALSDPLQTITGWSGPYSSTSALSYTVAVNQAYDPVPSNGKVVGTSLAELNWTNPDPNNPADIITCDVYFLDAGTSLLTQDPNMGPDVTEPGVEQIAFNTTAETVTLPGSVLPLQDDHYYYWAVHATDSNTPGTGVTTQGNTWYFFTGDAAPVPGQPVDQYMWLAQDDSAYDGGENNPNVLWFQVTATYTDDGKSTVTDANFVNLSWGWDPDGVNGEVQRGVTEVSDIHTPGVGGGTVTAIYKTEYNATDPNYTTDITGYFDIQLEVTDGTGTATGASGHHEIHATCGGAAYWDPDDTFDGTYDFNGDCIVNSADFADFAKAWLYQGVKYE